MVLTYEDEKSLQDALNTLLFDGKPKVIVKGEVFTIINVL